MRNIIKRLFIFVFVCVALIGGTGTTAEAKSKVKLNTKSITMEVGSSKKLTLKKAKAKKVKWSTSNKKIAMVVKGKVTAKSSGSCKVYAKYQGKKYTCKVTVKAQGKEVEEQENEETTEQTTTEKKQNKKKTKEQQRVDPSKYTVKTDVQVEPGKTKAEKIAENEARWQAFKEAHGVQDWKIMFAEISKYPFPEKDEYTPLDYMSAAMYWYEQHPYGIWNEGLPSTETGFVSMSDDNLVFESNYQYTCWACMGVAAMMESMGYKTIIIGARGIVGHRQAIVFLDDEHYVVVDCQGMNGGFKEPWVARNFSTTINVEQQVTINEDGSKSVREVEVSEPTENSYEKTIYHRDYYFYQVKSISDGAKLGCESYKTVEEILRNEYGVSKPSELGPWSGFPK